MSARGSQAAPPSLAATYVHLLDDRSAQQVPVDDRFWPELMRGARPELERGRMVMQFDFAADWSTWERHPAGEELVVLIKGRAELILERDGEEVLTLARPGQFLLVPRGVWHTARVLEPCSMLFITPGEGTENRPR